ncbi:MAG: phospholipase D-like domain-containing protein [Pirellulaceae bacterium]
MNITCEDIHPRRTDQSWEDLGFVVEGPVVSQYDSVCRADWKFATGQDIDSKASHRYWSTCDELTGNAVVQVLPAGPDVDSDPMYSGSLAAILRARKRLWIATPYFVPNDSLTEALVIACKSDVDVRILVPQKSNHRVSDIARSAFLRQIQKAGGQVMFLPKA